MTLFSLGRCIVWGLMAGWCACSASVLLGATPLWVTTITHFDRPWEMQRDDLDALAAMARVHPDVRWTHLFNPVAYTQATPLLAEMEPLLRQQQQAGVAELGVHLHMYPSLVQAAGVPFRIGPSANARRVAESEDRSGYAVPITAYSSAEIGQLLGLTRRLFAEHQLGTPRTFCAGFYTTSLELQTQLVQYGYTASAAAFPQHTGVGRDYAPTWQELCGWQGKVSHLTRPYWVSERSILPGQGPPYLRRTQGPLLEIPQTCKIDWMLSAEEMLRIFREHVGLARSGRPTAVCLALHEVSVAEQAEKFQQVFREIAAFARESKDVEVRWVTANRLRQEFLALDWAGSLHPAFENFDPSGLFRLQTPNDVAKMRQELIEFIWPSGLPTQRPSARTRMTRDREDPFSSLHAESIAQIEAWSMAVPPTDYEGVAHYLAPAHPAPKPQLVLVHAGHVRDGAENDLSDGLAEAIDGLLARGLHVVVFQMPQKGWHQRLHGLAPDRKTFQIDGHRMRNHDDLFAELAPTLHGRVLAIFLEPVIQAVNEFEARFPSHAPTVMLGLSGGGWATHVASAIDTRITLSIPVAGAMPLYARKFSYSSWGDAEQVFAPLYGEIDTNQDTITDQASGIASWLELFALGSIGTDSPRRQIQLLNYYDSCCFGGEVYRTYDEYMRGAAEKLGGNWTLVQDRSHEGHKISEHGFQTIILPAIEQVTAEQLHRDQAAK